MCNYEIKLPNLKVSREDLLEELKLLSIKLDKNQLKQKDIMEHSKYSYTTYRNHFGTFRKALEAANLEPSRNWGTTKEQYLENIINVWEHLRRQPKLQEMDGSASKHSSSSYTHYFGSWSETLLELDNWLSKQDLPLSKSRSKTDNDSHSNIHSTSRFPNMRLRFIVLKRDNFKCCACGASPAKDPSVELHVDHIIPWAKGGETVIDNLQTLCSKCNLGKGDME
jgi:hypothetical protein